MDLSVEMAESGLSLPFDRDHLGKPRLPLQPDALFAFADLIRRTEELLLKLFSQGLLSGTTHTCIGQELCQMSVVRALEHDEDVVLSNHRNHGHFLTYSGDVLGLVAEIMGRETGVCRGIGGSQHLAYRHFHSNGVQAGMTAIAAGLALAGRMRGSSGIVACIIGDGTLGEGLVYESMNLASIWRLPVLFVVEHNGIAQTTDTRDTIGGSILDRGAAFGLRTWQLDDADPQLFAGAQEVVDEVRRSRTPGWLVIDTRRLGPHSKGDDRRGEAEMAAIRARDPLERLGASLGGDRRAAIEAANRAYVEAVRASAAGAPEARLDGRRRAPDADGRRGPLCAAPDPPAGSNVRAALNGALRHLLAEHPDVVLLGEDLHDPYGGAFKVTAGLSTAFPDRVISTPISEAGVVGAAIGLAMGGRRPIAEIMFADFITLAMDQIYNHAAKFHAMFDDVRVPLVIRTPSGGRRGYGPTHSQSPEHLLAGVPGLTVVCPSHRHDAGTLLHASVDAGVPVVFFEHKLLYGVVQDRGDYEALPPSPSDVEAWRFPTLARLRPAADLTVIAYGGMLPYLERAADALRDEDLDVEIVSPSLLRPLPCRTIVDALADRAAIAVVEECPLGPGVGSELAAALLERGFRGRFVRIAPPPVPIPAARSCEAEVIPDERRLFERLAAFAAGAHA